MVQDNAPGWWRSTPQSDSFPCMEETYQGQACTIVLTDSFSNEMKAITEHLLLIYQCVYVCREAILRSKNMMNHSLTHVALIPILLDNS